MEHTNSSWIVERTVSTHNHPTRFWETSVLSPLVGLVATSHSETQGGAMRIGALIAAAPDLLEKLKDLVDACDGNYRELIDECNAVIAKAEGR